MTKKVMCTILCLCLEPCWAEGKAVNTFSIKGEKIELVEVVETEKMREEKDKLFAKRQDANYLILQRALYPDKKPLWKLPKNYQDVTIAGKAQATKEQAAAYLKLYNYTLPIAARAEDIVNAYYVEAKSEDIKWDIAFCQALVETGFFTFGGTVVPEQNNFCGLGTVNANTRGVYFLTPQLGVRAHIQHLLAYSTKELPKTEIIDPRYYLVYNTKLTTGFSTKWSDLNGKWATGSDYCEKILDLHSKMREVIAVSGEEM